MKKTIPIILGVLWLATVAILAFFDGADWSYKESMNLCQGGIQAGNSFYIMDNREEESVVYHINENHQVVNLFRGSSYKSNLTFVGLSFLDNLFLLLEEAEGTYRIIALDETLQPIEESGSLVPKEKGELTGFTAKEDGFYLTVVAEGGDKAVTYFLEEKENMRSLLSEEIKEGSREDKKEITQEGDPKQEEAVFLKMVRMSEAPQNRKIVEASFDNEEYKIRLDNGVGKEHFLLSQEILDAYYERQLSLKQTLGFQRQQLFFYGELLLAGYAVLILISIVLKNRSHTLYTIVIVEIILLVVTVSGVAVTYRVAQDAVLSQNKKFGIYYLEELKRQIGPNYKAFVKEDSFHENEIYDEMWKQMEDFLKEEGPNRMLYSLALVRLEDNRIMVGSTGKNMEHVAYQYGTAVLPLLELIKEGYDNGAVEVWLEGKRHLVIAVSDKEGISSNYCYVGLLKTETSVGNQELERYLGYGTLIFMIGSMLTIALVLLQARELKGLQKAILLLAAGDDNIRKERAYGKDIETMWNSLLDIKKRISRINYAKFQLYESCYRFAPKNVEKILKRESITEVKSGDAIELYGTLAMVNTSKAFHMNIPTMHQINRYVELMEKHKEKLEGLFLSGSNNLKNMKILFLRECTGSTEFGINFMKEFQQTEAYGHFQTGILLHYDHYVYGVAGSDSQCFSFLFYRKMERLEKLGFWLQAKGVKMAITETVKNREGINSGVRYIGYIQFGEERMNLYEVLDACKEEERKRKAANTKKFENAIALFYEYDFYLARSSFSEIIRENPQDEIAKWYLFTCQKYLNQSYGGDISFELWEKE